MYAYYEGYFIPQASIAFPPQSTYPQDKTINVWLNYFLI